MLTNLIGAFGATTYYNYHYQPASTGISYAALVPLFMAVGLVSLFLIACNWKVYQKAGRPGWAAIVPIYNSWVLLEMGGQPGWWALLSLIPIVNLVAVVFVILAEIEIARRFGKGNGFAALLVFLPIIALPILAFGKAQYTDPTSPVPQGGAVRPPQPPVVPSDPVAPTPLASTDPTPNTAPPTAPIPPVEPPAQPQVTEPTNPNPQDPQTPTPSA